MDADAKTKFIDSILAAERVRLAKIEHEFVEELVAAEREACAKIADDMEADRFVHHEQRQAQCAAAIAAAIRART